MLLYLLRNVSWFGSVLIEFLKGKIKSIVIADNGPSLAEINYRCLLKNVDTCRVNQFFFEEKYYLDRDASHIVWVRWIT
ncbi:alpha-2,3-sialyltransferase [Brevinema andersonii]|uniref:alpha-2,3-sialyltransferase n=1 Tax=Brevinema andersonii TaxID=34097 RepID=UPI000B87821B